MTSYVVQPLDHTVLTAQLNAAALRLAAHTPIQPRWQPSPPGPQAPGFRASSAHGCQRLVAYRLHRTPETDSVRNPDYDKAADQGTLLHRLLQDEAQEAGLVWQHPTVGPALELPLALATHPSLEADRGSIPFSGTIDGVLRQKNGTLAIWDIKTVGSTYLQPGNRWLPEKLQGYATQVSSYLHYFATPDGEQAQGALVLLVSRDDTSRRALYRVPVQPAVFAEDFARLRAASAAVTAGALPVAEVSSACRFCAWQRRCRQDGRAAASEEVAP